jgi:hypothetical protein
VELPDDVGADITGGDQDPKQDPDAPLVRACQLDEPHPPRTQGRERISGLAMKPVTQRERTLAVAGEPSWLGSCGMQDEHVSHYLSPGLKSTLILDGGRPDGRIGNRSRG